MILEYLLHSNQNLIYSLGWLELHLLVYVSIESTDGILFQSAVMSTSMFKGLTAVMVVRLKVIDPESGRLVYLSVPHR